MPTKDRLLVLLQTLQEKSDDETWLTTADLHSAPEKKNANNPSIYCAGVRSISQGECSNDKTKANGKSL